MQAESRSQAPLKSIEEYNRQNPKAATAAKAASEKVQQAPSSTVKADGTATCLNKGCQKAFVVAENNETACRCVKGDYSWVKATKCEATFGVRMRVRRAYGQSRRRSYLSFRGTDKVFQ